MEKVQKKRKLNLTAFCNTESRVKKHQIRLIKNKGIKY